MEPLDLRKRPPRSCREELDGLMMLPRTIDKLRARLPGGDPGAYFIDAHIQGLSGFLLQRLGVSEEDLLDVVGRSKTDQDVAAWLRAHVDTSKYASINRTLCNVGLEHAQDPDWVRGFYASAMRARPELTKIIDIVDADDRLAFSGGILS